MQDELAVVLLPQLPVFGRFRKSLVLEESCDLAHSGSRFLLGGGEVAQRAAVFLREDLDKARPILGPFLEDFLGASAARERRVALDQFLEDRLVGAAEVPQMPGEPALLLGLGENR